MNDRDTDTAAQWREEPAKLREVERKAAQLAVGLMRQDLAWLAAPFSITLVPQIILLFSGCITLPTQVLLGTMEHLLCFGFGALITVRTLKKLGDSGVTVPIAATSFLIVQAVGFGLWFALIVPRFLSEIPGADSLQPVGIALLICGLYLCWVYCLYTFTAFLPGATRISTLEHSKAFVRSVPLLPLRVALAPAAIASLGYAIARAPYPDGRLASLEAVGLACLALSWPLSCYLSLGWCLSLLDQATWRSMHLTGYRDGRLETLRMGGKGFLSTLLPLRGGLTLALTASLVGMADLGRLMEMPPSGTFEVSKVTIRGSFVEIDLEIHDPDHRLRGFTPQAFALAGAQRTTSTISPVPEAAQIDTASGEVLACVPLQSGPAQLKLTFKTTRKHKDLVSIEDLYLWYRSAKLVHLDLKGADSFS